MAATRLCGFDEAEPEEAPEALGIVGVGPTEVWWHSACGEEEPTGVPRDALFCTTYRLDVPNESVQHVSARVLLLVVSETGMEIKIGLKRLIQQTIIPKRIMLNTIKRS